MASTIMERFNSFIIFLISYLSKMLILIEKKLNTFKTEGYCITQMEQIPIKLY